MASETYSEFSCGEDKINEIPRDQMSDIDSMLGNSFDFLNVQIKLYEAQHLLQEVFDKHRYYARCFEVAFVEKHQKIIELIEVNKQLSQELEERTPPVESPRRQDLEETQSFYFESFPGAFESKRQEEKEPNTPKPEIWLTNDAGTIRKFHHDDDGGRANEKLGYDEEEISVGWEGRPE